MEKTDFEMIHIPRTAGSSIKSLLGHYGRPHQRASKLRYGTKFMFTWVRNPWDRILSLWLYPSNNSDRVIRDKFTDFNEWCCSIHEFRIKETQAGRFRNHLGRYLTAAYQPYHWWVDARVNFIGRYENLYEDVEKLGNELKLDLDLSTMPHMGQSERGPYQDYYDNCAKDAIYKLYEKDIKKYRYEF
jgi:chondroitin 4-sulfotransferase 11